ncbi:MAG: hypothetical protein DPW18_04685 [Chloroflexi bacterium]|nr:hypothetical protein [Chloroflexi bacterium CFX2]MCQ3936326.1 hypothetical protein [Chloroflexota bacterium]MDL1942635.1 hypothetical protein [Chloroflexi bacterium CFX2]
MLLPSDLLRLPYTADLTEGGIAYALRSLPFLQERAGAPLADGLRRTVANIAVELAFRRHLSQLNIPYEVRATASFAEHERFDVFLDGRRCGIKSFFISDRNQIKAIRENPAVLLNAPALVPADVHAADGHAYNDVYIFAFATGVAAASHTDLQKAIARGLPHHLVHVMPKPWRQPSNWNPLGALTLKSESAEEIIVEINGQDAGREMKRKGISLPPGGKVKLDESFYSIAALRVRRLPEARIGIRCESNPEAHLISPFDWSNLWVYGMDIFIAGCLSYEEFTRHAKMLPPNTPVFQYKHTKTKNLAVQVAELKPIGRLLETAGKNQIK